MAKTPLRVVLDTNVLISSFLFGGIPREVLFSVLAKDVNAVTSAVLLAELIDILAKKFKISKEDLQLINSQMRDNFKVVYPKKEILVVRDVADNKVLEAGIEGKCGVIVTGDRDLLVLKKYKTIQIVTPTEFLKILDL